MKKLISVCLALVLLAVCIPLQASAEGTPTFAVGAVQARVGETVEVPILIENNPGIIALSVSISFDRNVLTLQDAASASLFSEGAFTFGGTYDTDTFKIIWENGTGSNATENGAFATLTFLVSEDAPLGDTVVSISYTASSVFDVYLTEVAFDTRAGAVTVLPAEVGGWSFSEDCTLCTYEGDNGVNYVVGLDIVYPVISEYIITTGGWSAEVEPNNYDSESTGAKLVISDENGTVVEEYYSVLFGDINGDAIVDQADQTIIQYTIGFTNPEPWAQFIFPDEYPQSFAADANHDYILDPGDVTCVSYSIGNTEEIVQIP